MNEQERINRANSLRLVVENDHYISAVNEVRSRLQSEWQNSKASEAEKRERLYVSLRLLEQVTGLVSHHIETGEVDKKKIDEVNGRRRLFKHDNW